MKNKPLLLLKWLVPIIFIAIGIFLTNFIQGHGFLGFISFCIAGIFICRYLISLLCFVDRMVEKRVRTAFLTVLLLVISLCFATEAVIVRAGMGDTGDISYLVVLGAKVNRNGPSLSLSERIDAAYDYLIAHPNVTAILSGGQGEDETISEAQCMYSELTKRGIAASRLWMEDKSTSTWENIGFSLDLIEKKTGIRPDQIGLLSSEYHLFRAKLFAKDCGVSAIGIPAKTGWFSLRLNYFTREVAGVWHYLILGGHYYD